MTRTKLIYAMIVATCLAGCARDTDPAPIRDWDSVVQVFEAFLVRGEKDQIREHSFIDGVPRKHRKNADTFLVAWRGIPKRMQLSTTEVIGWSEYMDRQNKKREQSNDNFVVRWMPTPDRIIVYHFQAGEEGKDGFAKAEWIAGAYQRSDGWRFAAQWLEAEK